MTKHNHPSRIHIPILAPEDVKPHLGKPDLHWKPGYSAQLTATTWFAAGGLPDAIGSILSSSASFGRAELVDAFLERTVDLGDGGRPSQTDVMAIVAVGDRLGVVAVEAKVEEPFGPVVQEWLAEGQSNADAGAGRSVRLDHLCALLELPRAIVMPLRYQLLHRTASALIEARRYRTALAAMVVQSFSKKERQTGLSDFQSFAEAMGFGHLKPSVLSGSKAIGGINLSLGWAPDVQASLTGQDASA